MGNCTVCGFEHMIAEANEFIIVTGGDGLEIVRGATRGRGRGVCSGVGAYERDAMGRPQVPSKRACVGPLKLMHRISLEPHNYELPDLRVVRVRGARLRVVVA